MCDWVSSATSASSAGFGVAAEVHEKNRESQAGDRHEFAVVAGASDRAREQRFGARILSGGGLKHAADGENSSVFAARRFGKRVDGARDQVAAGALQQIETVRFEHAAHFVAGSGDHVRAERAFQISRRLERAGGTVVDRFEAPVPFTLDFAPNELAKEVVTTKVARRIRQR